jgi:hypothetical protein
MRISAANKGLKRSDVSSVKHWRHRFKSSEMDTGDSTRSGRPATAATMGPKDKLDVLIPDDRSFTSELCVSRYWKTGGYGHHQWTWLQKSLRKVGAENAHRRTQNNPKKHLYRTSPAKEKNGDDFQSRIITDDEIWVHHYDPLTKRQPMESPGKKKNSRCRLLQVKTWLASSGRVQESC